MKKSWESSAKVMGIILIVGALVGLLASFVLTHETLEVAKNPAYEPSCNINPLVSCSSVMSKPEAQVFGLPFSVFGILGFGALLVFAVLMAAGTKFAAWVWRAAIAAAGAGMLAVIYMIWLSMFSFMTICPWCFSMWVATIAIFWAVLTYIASARPYKLSKRCEKTADLWAKYAPMILAGLYVVLIFALFVRFNESIL